MDNGKALVIERTSRIFVDKGKDPNVVGLSPSKKERKTPKEI
jgi:hypothetical protein